MKTQLFIVAILFFSLLFFHKTSKAEQPKAIQLSQNDLQSIGFKFHRNKIVYKTLLSGKKVKFKITKKGITNRMSLSDQEIIQKNCCPILVMDSKQTIQCCMQVDVDDDVLVLPVYIQSENKNIEKTLFCFVYTDALQKKLAGNNFTSYLMPYHKVSGCNYETGIDSQQLADMLNLNAE